MNVEPLELSSVARNWKFVRLTESTWNGTSVKEYTLEVRVKLVKLSDPKTATTELSCGRSIPDEPRSRTETK